VIVIDKPLKLECIRPNTPPDTHGITKTMPVTAMWLIKQNLTFVSQLTAVASGLLYCSYQANTTPWVTNLLKHMPFTGKRRYFDGEKTPLSRGYLHGIMSLLHLYKACYTRSIAHTFLVVQYVASFMLHNVPFTVPNEHKIAAVDNICIASHIALLASLGAPKNYWWKGGLLSVLGTSCAIAQWHPEGVGSWMYKMSLMPNFVVGALAWHSSGKLYLAGSPRIPFIYMTAFAIFALHKRGTFDKWGGLWPAVSYDLFHGLQVVATLCTLRQVGEL
jgi:hypothetical protein